MSIQGKDKKLITVLPNESPELGRIAWQRHTSVAVVRVLQTANKSLTSTVYFQTLVL
jgi:hypothetical protein